MSRDIQAGTHPHPLLARKTDYASRLAIIGSYQQGVSLAAIGRESGLSTATVKKVLFDAGVALRPNSQRGKPFTGRAS